MSLSMNLARASRLGGLLLSHSSRKPCLFQATPALASVQSKTLSLTSARMKRHYGPEEEHEKVNDVHHWLHERYVAIALIPIIPTALAFPHPIMDTALVGSVMLHVHWRMSGVAEDYIHGEVLPRIAQPLVLILSIAAFGSLCYFNYTDIGFANAVRMLYSQV